MNPINEEHSIVTPSGAGRATDAEGGSSLRRRRKLLATDPSCWGQ